MEERGERVRLKGEGKEGFEEKNKGEGVERGEIFTDMPSS